MKPASAIRLVLSTFAFMVAILAGSSARAQIAYDVTLNTTALIGHPAGPFYLDFQLNDGSGSGDGNNFATLSHFTFGGGNVLGSASGFGSFSGNLSSNVTLTDSNAFNEFYQAFTPDASLGFRLGLTTHVDSPVPDLFSFAILDSSLANIPTLSFGSDAFIVVNITSVNPTIERFAGDGAHSPLAGAPALALAAPMVTPCPSPRPTAYWLS
jgi:hypothetical protein